MRSGRHLCVIPVRAGSKAFADKNISKLRGKSLLELAVEKAIQSSCFDEIVVSSDSEYYLEKVSKYSVTLSHRPVSLAGDSTTLALVSKYEVKQAFRRGLSCDFVSSLQVTSPLVSVNTIRGLINVVSDTVGATGGALVSEVVDHPYTAMKFDGLRLDWFMTDVQPRFPRQARPPVVRPTGGMYIRSARQALEYDGAGYSLGHYPLGYLINRYEAMDVNTESDLRIIELVERDLRT